MELVHYSVLECIDGFFSNIIPGWYIDYSEPPWRFLDSDFECTVAVYFASY